MLSLMEQPSPAQRGPCRAIGMGIDFKLLYFVRKSDILSIGLPTERIHIIHAWPHGFVSSFFRITLAHGMENILKEALL